MLDLDAVTKAAKAQLIAYADVVAIGATVESDEYVNMSPDAAPWVGVYKDNVNYTPATLGAQGRTFDADAKLLLVVQQTSYESGEDCGAKLSALLLAVLSGLWSDPTIGGTVEMLHDMNVVYEYMKDEEGSLHFQQAIVSVSLRSAEG